MIGKEHEYRAMANCERELWWYRSLHHLTLQKIKQYMVPANARILDAGCGTGGMLGFLNENGYSNITGFDLSSDAVHYSKTNFQFDVRLLNILECDSVYERHSFDIIINNDVLCLLNDGQDKIALQKLVSILKPGGYIFMNLPAGSAFKGTHDIAAAINKRYSEKKVAELASGTIKIKEFVYWPFLLSPLIFTVRFFQRIKIFFSKRRDFLSDVALPPAVFNRVFGKMTRWEITTLKASPWGSSIFLVLQKST